MGQKDGDKNVIEKIEPKSLLMWSKSNLTQKTTGWWFEIVCVFTSILGEMIQFDKNIFQMGWFNHQLEKYTPECGHHSLKENSF